MTGISPGVPPETKIALVALGGNALIKEDQRGTVDEQEANADEMCHNLMCLIERGYELVITHGNGPQVGQILLKNDLSKDQVPPMPLDVCVADSEGDMGYFIQTALLNQLRRLRMRKYVVTLITQVLVDKLDPAFENPTKPIGPFYTGEEARGHIENLGWKMVEDAGRGWRRVVPSPRPVKIIQRLMIYDMVKNGHIVIAAGGGGIPVGRRDNGDLEGIEAVIEKDFTSCRLAQHIEADLFVILTGVPQVSLNFGKPDEVRLNRLTVKEAKKHLSDGQFPPGSMGPKVEAAVTYLERTGGKALITSGEHLDEALAGNGGTWIVFE